MGEREGRGSAGNEILRLTRSQGETEALGRRLGRLLKAGDAVCLFGELGSGKTCLARGLVQGMGAGEEAVASPSFIMVNRYQGRFPIYHIDLYRLDSPADAEDIGLRDCLAEDGVAVIEWASRIEGGLPEERIDVMISHLSPTEREIRFVLRGRGCAAGAGEIVKALTGG